MPAIYQDEIIGAREQAESARKLREMALQQPTGQMVSGHFIAPHWTQYVANSLRQFIGNKEEADAKQEAKELTRQQNLSTIQALNAAGIEAPQAMVDSVSKPAIEPGMMDRFVSFLRGDEAKTVPAQAYQQKVAQNLTPDQRELALMQLSMVNPEVGKPIMEYQTAKQRREEANADRDAYRQLAVDKFYSLHGVQPGQGGAVVGNRVINPLGNEVSVQPLPRANAAGTGGRSSAASGDPSVLDRRDVQILKLGNGQFARVNKRTGEAFPIEAEGNVPTAGSDPKLTEDQGKATGWYAVAKNAVSNMEKAKFKQDDQGNIIRDASGQPIPADVTPGLIETMLPQSAETLRNLSRSPSRQLYEHEASNLTEAAIRAATGAGLNEGEVRDKIRTLTPQYGDTPAKIAQKERDLQIYLDTLKLRAGPGADMYERKTQQPQPSMQPINPPGQPAPTSSVDDLVNKYRRVR